MVRKKVKEEDVGPPIPFDQEIKLPYVYQCADQCSYRCCACGSYYDLAHSLTTFHRYRCENGYTDPAWWKGRLQRRQVKHIQQEMLMGCAHGELKLRNEKETAFVNLYRSRKQRSLLVAMFLHGRSCIASSARDSVVLVGIGSTNLI